LLISDQIPTQFTISHQFTGATATSTDVQLTGLQWVNTPEYRDYNIVYKIKDKILRLDVCADISNNETMYNKTYNMSHYIQKLSELNKYAERMIEKNIRVNNEFYTAPLYNQYIQDGKLISHYPIAEMFQLGTPEELAANTQKVIDFFKSRSKGL
jgi:hypothetical protein